MTEVRVEDLVGSHEVSQILNLTDARINQLRRAGKFVEPVHKVAATPLWLIPDVLEWDRTRVKGKPGRPRKVAD